MSDELKEIKTLLEGINEKLTHLQDVEEIERLIVSYARGCDRGNDPEIIGPLFTEDGTWECKGFGKYIGRDKLAKGLYGIAGKKIWWSLHYMISPLIDIDTAGDSVVVLLDIDRFSFLNETMGYDAGTELLRSVGNRLRRTLCEEQTGSRAIVGRFGADEFIDPLVIVRR